MKWNILLGTLVLGLGLCTQSFGFELLDRMLGVRYSSPSCCDSGPSCGCDNVCDPACGCDNGCAPACDNGCAPACDNGCDNGCEPACGCDTGCAPKCCKKRTCLLDKLFAAKKCCKKPCCDTTPVCGCDNGCEPACGCDNGHGNGCDPACGCDNGHGNGCEPACGCDNGHGNGCEPACGCDNGHGNGCEPACGCDTGCAPKKSCKKRGLLHSIFGKKARKCCTPCCTPAPACGCEPSCGVAAPAQVHAEDAAPVPPAPMTDPSAFVPTQRRVVQASVNFVR